MSRILTVLLLLLTALNSAVAANQTLAGQEEVVFQANQTYSISVGEYLVTLKATKPQTLQGQPLETSGQVLSPKFYGAVRFVDCTVRLASGKKAKVEPQISEHIQTLDTNVKGMRRNFVKPVTAISGQWFDIQALGDEVALPTNSRWVVIQRLYVEGRYFASFRLEYTPTNVVMTWVPEAQAPPLPASETLLATR